MEKNSVRISVEAVKFVAANYSTMSTEKLMEETELSVGQINNIMMAVRRSLRAKATTEEEAAKIETLIKEKYSRAVAENRGSTLERASADLADELLAGL